MTTIPKMASNNSIVRNDTDEYHSERFSPNSGRRSLLNNNRNNSLRRIMDKFHIISPIKKTKKKVSMGKSHRNDNHNRNDCDIQMHNSLPTLPPLDASSSNYQEDKNRIMKNNTNKSKNNNDDNNRNHNHKKKSDRKNVADTNVTKPTKEEEECFKVKLQEEKNALFMLHGMDVSADKGPTLSSLRSYTNLMEDHPRHHHRLNETLSRSLLDPRELARLAIDYGGHGDGGDLKTATDAERRQFWHQVEHQLNDAEKVLCDMYNKLDVTPPPPSSPLSPPKKTTTTTATSSPPPHRHSHAASNDRGNRDASDSDSHTETSDDDLDFHTATTSNDNNNHRNDYYENDSDDNDDTERSYSLEDPMEIARFMVNIRKKQYKEREEKQQGNQQEQQQKQQAKQQKQQQKQQAKQHEQQRQPHMDIMMGI